MTGREVGVLAEFAANTFPVLGREAQKVTVESNIGIDCAGGELGDEVGWIGVWFDASHCWSGAWADWEPFEEIDVLRILIGDVDENFGPKKMVIETEEGKDPIEAVEDGLFLPG